MSKKHLLKASALYKNDTLSGIGIIIENTSGNLKEILGEGLENYEMAWEEANDDMRKKYVIGYFQQLNHFSQFRAAERDEQQNLMCFLNILFLERHGFLKNDNFNGCSFLYDTK